MAYALAKDYQNRVKQTTILYVAFLPRCEIHIPRQPPFSVTIAYAADIVGEQ